MLMEPGRWARITEIYHATIACPPEERASFVGQECHGDESLRRQVEAMVKSHERAGDFIETPAFALAPELLIDVQAVDLIGQSISHYQIESLLGVGGMGAVYLARDERLGRKVALKLLPEHLKADETQLSRFKTEARSASALNHPNILTVYEIGAEGTRRFIATEFIEGITLRASLMCGRMNLHDALEIAVQVASALVAAHEAGVVHRDLKPENIMLRPDGYVKVLDFGIAKLTEQRPASDDDEVGTTVVLQTRLGLVLGTARYMSPEQARGQTVDARSDIWSLGVVIYEMIAGIPPFAGETPSDCIASILTTEPLPLSGVLPEVPLNLESIVQKALCKNRDERYQTIKEMLADLRNLKEEAEAEGPPPQIKARAESIVSKIKRHKQGVSLTLAAAMLVAAAFVYSFYFVATVRSANEKSIAVLPFENLSEEKSNAYFTDGIQDEILTRLSKIADLKVISRTSTQRYKHTSQRPSDIAHQLGVANLLEGSVQKTNDQVRVNVQLITAANDTHLWAETYDRKLTDIFAVESDIATAIAKTLQARLTGPEKTAIAKRPTANPEAYELYLKGRFFWNKRTATDLRKAIEYFNQALGKDPSYALAYAGLSDAYLVLSLYGAASPADSFPQAIAAAKKAIELDDTLAEAHTSLACSLAYYDFDFDQSLKEFQRAIELNPNYATAHHWLSNGVLSALGQFERAIAEGKRAVELDPLSLIINADLGQDFFYARRYDEAIVQLRKTIEMDPRFYFAHWALGTALQLKGPLSEAIAEYSKAVELNDDPFVLAFLGQAYARAGQRDEAQKILARLSEEAKSRYVHGYSFALMYLALGDKERAIDEMERAYRERDANVVEIKVDPMLDDLRGNPRFEVLVNQIVPANVR
jgi:serine/threonine protein kinase/tetratricopeptide (TPR) repeat protein